VGTVVTVRTDNLPASALAVALSILLPPAVLGTPTTNLLSLPLESGCLNYIPNADAIVVRIPTAGAANVMLPLPADSWWVGKVVHMQAAVLSVSSTIDIEMSNGVCLHVGSS
jgi:hypothetical protein